MKFGPDWDGIIHSKEEAEEYYIWSLTGKTKEDYKSTPINTHNMLGSHYVEYKGNYYSLDNKGSIAKLVEVL